MINCVPCLSSRTWPSSDFSNRRRNPKEFWHKRCEFGQFSSQEASQLRASPCEQKIATLAPWERIADTNRKSSQGDSALMAEGKKIKNGCRYRGEWFRNQHTGCEKISVKTVIKSSVARAALVLAGGAATEPTMSSQTSSPNGFAGAWPISSCVIVLWLVLGFALRK